MSSQDTFPENVFLHTELEGALKSLSRGIWDFHHSTRGKLFIVKRNKGYTQHQFEAELTEIAQVRDKAKLKIDTCPVDLNNRVHLLDSLFYKLSWTLLDFKLQQLAELHETVLNDDLDDVTQPNLADYFLQQQTEVSTALKNFEFVFSFKKTLFY